jgi:hypothetical protein
LRRLFREIFGAGNAELRDTPQTSEVDATIDADETFPLPVLPQDFTQMSGIEFEHYMADVFEEQGYDATVLGGAGDQGVDLLLRKGNELVAVQCKNYGQRIGNKPVQEVFAGARHHGVQQAWVVAPAGFTRGALELARSTGVALFDRSAIENWLEEADSHRRVSRFQREMDLGDYGTLLTLYSHMLDNLECHLSIESRCASEMAYGPKVRERSEQARRALYGHIKSFVRDLDTLEGRNPEFAAEDPSKHRAKVEARQKQIELWAQEQGISAEPMNGGEQISGTVASEAPTLPPSITVPPKRLNRIINETVTSAAGDTLTLHSCEVHHENGVTYLAIDMEGCAASNQKTKLKHLNMRSFQLQMTDNTHSLTTTLRSEHQYARLLYADLSPGDCARGWIFFEIPKDKKPKFLKFRGIGARWDDRWAIQRHW